LWHPNSFDYLSLSIGERLNIKIYVVSSLEFEKPEFEKPIIAKFARSPYEIGYYTAETQAYSWIDGHHIDPKFLGYLTEESWVIGFVIEHMEGRHATISDLPACEAIVGKLHGLGIVHGDLNKHNFLTSDKQAEELRSPHTIWQ